MDRAPRLPDRCQRIIDLIDACIAEHAASVPARWPDPAPRRRPGARVPR